jgi:predicted PhzF superfamily epimerase YddE/YHI9
MNWLYEGSRHAAQRQIAAAITAALLAAAAVDASEEPEMTFTLSGVRATTVTGSLNASLAQWLIGAGLAKSSYVAAQGTALSRAGRVHLRKEGEEVWVGGDVVNVIHGEVNL